MLFRSPLKLGDITKAFAMGKRENTKITNLLATIVLERLFDIIALGILIVFPIYYFGIEFLFKDDFRLSILFGFALIAIVIAFLFILIFKKEFVIQIISKILSIVPFIKQREGFKFEIKNVFEQLNYALKELFDDWKQTVIVIFTSVLVWLLEGITAYYVADRKSVG